MQYSCRTSFGRRIGDFRGRLSGVSRRCPARQSQRRGATARTERPRTRRRRPRCRPGARTLRDRFSAALVAVDRCGALPNCLLLAACPPSRPVSAAGRDGHPWPEGSRRPESAATPRGTVGIGATSRRLSMGARELRNAARLQRGTGNRTERATGGHFSCPDAAWVDLRTGGASAKTAVSQLSSDVRRSTKASRRAPTARRCRWQRLSACHGAPEDRRRLICREAARRAESRARPVERRHAPERGRVSCEDSHRAETGRRSGR